MNTFLKSTLVLFTIVNSGALHAEHATSNTKAATAGPSAFERAIERMNQLFHHHGKPVTVTSGDARDVRMHFDRFEVLKPELARLTVVRTELERHNDGSLKLDEKGEPISLPPIKLPLEVTVGPAGEVLMTIYPGEVDATVLRVSIDQNGQVTWEDQRIAPYRSKNPKQKGKFIVSKDSYKLYEDKKGKTQYEFGSENHELTSRFAEDLMLRDADGKPLVDPSSKEIRFETISIKDIPRLVREGHLSPIPASMTKWKER